MCCCFCPSRQTCDGQYFGSLSTWRMSTDTLYCSLFLSNIISGLFPLEISVSTPQNEPWVTCSFPISSGWGHTALWQCCHWKGAQILACSSCSLHTGPLLGVTSFLSPDSLNTFCIPTCFLLCWCGFFLLASVDMAKGECNAFGESKLGTLHHSSGYWRSVHTADIHLSSILS